MKAIRMINDQQLKNRRYSIGGSDIAALLGLSPWRTPVDVYLEKTDPDFVFPASNIRRLQAGNLLEEWVANSFTEETGLELVLNPATMRHKDYPYSHVNLDAVVTNAEKFVVVELKTSERKKDWRDGIPKYYKPQLMHARVISECRQVYLAVAIGFNEFKYFLYEPSQTDIEKEKKLQEIVKFFWEEHVIPKVPPEPKFYQEAVRLYPEADPGLVKLATDAHILYSYEKLKRLKEVMDQYKEEMQQLKAQIGNYMQNAEELMDEFSKKMITWRNHPRRQLDIKSFQKDHPELYEKYVKPIDSRVMKIY